MSIAPSNHATTKSANAHCDRGVRPGDVRCTAALGRAALRADARCGMVGPCASDNARGKCESGCESRNPSMNKQRSLNRPVSNVDYVQQPPGDQVS